jgi:DNA-binding NtrC family response regulator
MKRVWVIDRQHWPRALLRGELLENGLDVVGFVSPEDALAALEAAITPGPNLIVVELKGLGAGGDEGLTRLASTGLPIMVLGGAVELNREAVRMGEWSAILKRPFTLGQVVQAVNEFLDISSTP